MTNGTVATRVLSIQPWRTVSGRRPGSSRPDLLTRLTAASASQLACVTQATRPLSSKGRSSIE
eukprot:4999079-Karenia_brevis.AAC.1